MSPHQSQFPGKSGTCKLQALIGKKTDVFYEVTVTNRYYSCFSNMLLKFILYMDKVHSISIQSASFNLIYSDMIIKHIGFGTSHSIKNARVLKVFDISVSQANDVLEPSKTGKVFCILKTEREFFFQFIEPF